MLYVHRAIASPKTSFLQSMPIDVPRWDLHLNQSHGIAANSDAEYAGAGRLALAEDLVRRFNREVGRVFSEAEARGDEVVIAWFMEFEDSDALAQPTRSTLLSLLERCPSEYLRGLLAGCCLWQIEVSGLSGRSVGTDGAEEPWAVTLDKQERLLAPLLATHWADPAVASWRNRYDDLDLLLAPLDEIYQLAQAAPTAFSAGLVYSVVRRRREEARLMAAIHGA